MNKKFKKKAMSEVVSSILMIVLVLVLIGVVWGVIRNLMDKELNKTEACFGNFDKISLDDSYTCYNITSTPDEFYFSINVGDINLDKILVSISIQGTTNSIELNSTSRTIANVRNYPTRTTSISAPLRNQGRTYIYATTIIPDSIKISPVINGEKCQESDSITNIGTCSVY
jgi:FlaG/FlaF family flagellin (archaellin)